VVRNPSLLEVTLIHAERLGYDDQGKAHLAPGGRWQISVFRSGSGSDSAVLTRRISNGIAELRKRPEGGGLSTGKWARDGPAQDPTAHLTFSSAASRGVGGAPIWTDSPGHSWTRRCLPHAGG